MFDPNDYPNQTWQEREAEARAEYDDACEIEAAAADHDDEISYTEIFGSAHIAAPVEAALASWRRSQAIAQTTPRFAQIGNGLFFPVGTGKKRRAA